ncbi:MAG: type II toxin-antitoxin system HicB family antitoxin [Desulfobacula sp.]|uniref:type II toxin-antitoxin system HicB family antitoxin n=1 Tax=Desulfobacula sp. TaxID=2593537 RepID=UPI0025C31981|nr:type II toxin-antitoxin system HicB family antitoxin [Desulfobacula sp.]MCD4718426.1 type II toxin-antitoxin system HicB family antitoxin [Desulfobacula sp.]
MKYLVVIEETKTGFSSYSPDMDGCVATGRTKREVEKNMKEAMEFHLEGLRLEHQETPKPHSYSSYVEVMA